MTREPTTPPPPAARAPRREVVSELRALFADGRATTIPSDVALLTDGERFPVRVSDDHARTYPSTSGIPDAEMTGVPPSTAEVRRHLGVWARKCVLVATGDRRIGAQRWVELLASCSDAELEAAYGTN